ncbi:MAG: exosome complex protein Rrp42 [Methanobacteriota archaeon]
MGDDVVSEIKREYIYQMARDGKRLDGRGFDEYRRIEIETGMIKQAAGSARVKIGDTQVYVGVKIQPAEPFDDQPNSGVMTTNAEMLPMADPEFETGPPQPPAIELARVVDRGIRETETIDFDKLCITPGEKVWMNFIDIHIVDNDGNLIDAASLGAMAALLTATVPAAKHKVGEDYPLPIEHFPVTCTATKLKDAIVFDPGHVESKLGRPRLTVSTDENGNIRAMQKGLAGGFTRAEVRHVIDTARLRGNEIRAHLLKETGRKL